MVRVSFDETAIYKTIFEGTDREETSKFPWNEIKRICYTKASSRSYDYYTITLKKTQMDDPTYEKFGKTTLIQLNFPGASELWSEIIERGFFDADLAEEAANGKLEDKFCYDVIRKEIERDLTEDRYKDFEKYEPH